MKKMPSAISGGFHTSPAANKLSSFAHSALDDAHQRFAGIQSDDSRTPAAKAKFLQTFKSSIRENVERPHLHNLRVEIKDQQSKLDSMAKPGRELSTHAAMLLAEAFRTAEPATRMQMMSEDSRYIELLDELPASYWGVTPERHAEMRVRAREFQLTPEQRDIAKTIDADSAALESIERRRDSLLNEIDKWMLAHADAISKSDSNAHLYNEAEATVSALPPSARTAAIANAFPELPVR